jgi:NADPH:quinone reductase-like Zn-dependent oxidoreductase
MYLAGVVETIGSACHRFKPGDRIYGASAIRMGACAEYVCVPESAIFASMPANLSFEEAAAAPLGGLNALHFIEKANLVPGQKILINGAAGGIGTSATQLAKLAGAEVTAVDHADKLAMLASVGADHLIDYTRVDFTSTGEIYDVILDVVGTSPYARSLAALKSGGRYILANPLASQMLRARWSTRTTDKQVIVDLAPEAIDGLTALTELMKAGRLVPIIDRCYPLEATADAHRYIDAGFKQGNVVLSIVPADGGS